MHYAINEAHLDPDKPAFLCVLPKGGGTAKSAGRAALEAGEFDYAWTLQVTPEARDTLPLPAAFIEASASG
ncbi:MAG: peptide ABC transporter substrate-binding protein, partial [Pseudomonadota bacterium]